MDTATQQQLFLLGKDVIENAVVPEIMAFVRRHQSATGELPTDAQVLTALGADTDAGIRIGEAFLAAKGAA